MAVRSEQHPSGLPGCGERIPDFLRPLLAHFALDVLHDPGYPGTVADFAARKTNLLDAKAIRDLRQEPVNEFVNHVIQIHDTDFVANVDHLTRAQRLLNYWVLEEAERKQQLFEYLVTSSPRVIECQEGDREAHKAAVDYDIKSSMLLSLGFDYKQLVAGLETYKEKADGDDPVDQTAISRILRSIEYHVVREAWEHRFRIRKLSQEEALHITGLLVPFIRLSNVNRMVDIAEILLNQIEDRDYDLIPTGVFIAGLYAQDSNSPARPRARSKEALRKRLFYDEYPDGADHQALLAAIATTPLDHDHSSFWYALPEILVEDEHYEYIDILVQKALAVPDPYIDSLGNVCHTLDLLVTRFEETYEVPKFELEQAAQLVQHVLGQFNKSVSNANTWHHRAHLLSFVELLTRRYPELINRPELHGLYLNAIICEHPDPENVIGSHRMSEIDASDAIWGIRTSQTSTVVPD